MVVTVAVVVVVVVEMVVAVVVRVVVLVVVVAVVVVVAAVPPAAAAKALNARQCAHQKQTKSHRLAPPEEHPFNFMPPKTTRKTATITSARATNDYRTYMYTV